MRAFDYLEDKDSNSLESILRDNGSGNFSRGMVFLELVSSAKRRENCFMLKCLDIPVCVNVGLVTKPVENVEVGEKIKFVLKSIRCEELGELVKEYDIDKYLLLKRLLVDIYDKVHEGRFYRKDYKYLLPYLKKTVARIQNTMRIQNNG